jgi:hypothetical protein
MPPVPRAPVEPAPVPQAADRAPAPEPTVAATPEFTELERLMQPSRAEAARPKLRPALSADDFAVRRESILKKPADTPVAELPAAAALAEPAIESLPVAAQPPAPPPAPEPVAVEPAAKPAGETAGEPTAEPAEKDSRSVFDNLEDEMASLLGRGGNRP